MNGPGAAAEGATGGPSSLAPPPAAPTTFERPPLPRAVALLALAAGLLAALGLSGQRPGLNVPAITVLTGAAALASRRVGREYWTTALGVVALALAATASVRDASWIVVPAVLGALTLGSLAVSGGRSWPGVLRGLGVTAARLWPGGMGLARACVALAAGRPALAPALRGGVLGGSLVAVFGLLFASGDAAFGHLVGQAVPSEVDVSSLARRGLWLVGAAVLAAALATGAGTLQSVIARPARRGIGAFELTIALLLLDGLFAAFAAVQGVVFFGGEQHVLQTAGLTYAQYARQGFAQLVVAAALTVAVIAGALRWGRAATTSEDRRLRGLLVVLCTLTFVVLASALARLDLYQDAFGATRLRLAVQATMLWIAGILALLGVAVTVARHGWLPRAAALFTGLALLAFTLYNPDLRIAQRNLQRQAKTGRLDVDYLAGLSADAVPALAPAGEPVATVALSRQRSRLADGDGVFEWNRSRSRARAILTP